MDEFSPLWIILIVCAVLFVVVVIAWIVDGLRFYESMGKASSVAERLKIKELLLKKRKLWLWALVILVVTPVIIFLAYPVILSGSIIAIALVVIMILSVQAIQILLKHIPEEIRSFLGNVSFKTVNEVLSGDEKFALFLRGFDSDVEFDQEIAPITSFSEEYLARVVKRGLGIPLYAVGRPNEIDSPHGAQRVYVDDEEWQHKVQELIRKAIRVFVHVSDSDSCLWELQCCEEFKSKCAFIITDSKKYLNASSRLMGKVSFLDAQLLEGIKDDEPYYYYDHLPVKSFERAYLAYNDMAGVDPPVSLADDPPKKVPPYIIILLIAVIIAAIAILSTMRF